MLCIVLSEIPQCPVVTYNMSLHEQTATVKYKISLTKVVRVELFKTRSITCLIPNNCAEFHGLHGGAIFYFMDPWLFEILSQMFSGTYFLGCV